MVARSEIFLRFLMKVPPMLGVFVWSLATWVEGFLLLSKKLSGMVWCAESIKRSLPKNSFLERINLSVYFWTSFKWWLSILFIAKSFEKDS